MQRKKGRLVVERCEQGAPVRSKHFAVPFEDALQGWRSRRGRPAGLLDGCRTTRKPIGILLSKAVRARSAVKCPAFNFVFTHKAQFRVNGLTLRSGIEFECGHAECVEVLNGSRKQPRSDASAAALGIDQHHANPREPAFVNDGRCRAEDSPFRLRHKASLRARAQEPLPIEGSLVPACELLQPHSSRDVRVGHDTQPGHWLNHPMRWRPRASGPHTSQPSQPHSARSSIRNARGVPEASSRSLPADGRADGAAPCRSCSRLS